MHEGVYMREQSTPVAPNAVSVTCVSQSTTRRAHRYDRQFSGTTQVAPAILEGHGTRSSMFSSHTMDVHLRTSWRALPKATAFNIEEPPCVIMLFSV